MLHSLHVAQTGLNTSKIAVENVMNNISNENTPGYKKRVVELEELEHLDSRVHGRGVSVEQTTRVTNMYMYDNLMKENSKFTYYDELSTMLSDIESVFYETDSSGITYDLNKYFQAIEDLRSNPYNEIYKNNLENQARILVQNIQNLHQEIEERATIAKTSLYDDIENVNNILADIGNLNEQISQRIVEPNDLLDKRDALENELSQYTNIEVDRTLDYELKIGGLTAVRYNTNIHNVKVVEEYQAQKDLFVYDNKTDNIYNQSSDPLSDGDSVTVRLNNMYEFTVNYGDTISSDIEDENGNVVITAGSTVDETNYIRVLVNQINTHEDIPPLITAYNGDYTLDRSGNKVYLEPRTQDHFLMIESSIPGENGEFEIKILKTNDSDNTAAVGTYTREFVDKHSTKSKEGIDDVHVEIFDAEISMTGGSAKAMVENLDTESASNEFYSYQVKLDQFVNALVDITHSYIQNSDGTYVNGKKASMVSSDTANTREIALFSGSSVNSLRFNEDAIDDLTQADLDYLATHQWKDDIGFDGLPQDGGSDTATSFSKFYQTLLVEVSRDKETADFMLENQEAVKESLQSTYDKIVKVDKDEEMLNLIKFQAAYEANAKIITAFDEMLQTLLGMKR